MAAVGRVDQRPDGPGPAASSGSGAAFRPDSASRAEPRTLPRNQPARRLPAACRRACRTRLMPSDYDWYFKVYALAVRIGFVILATLPFAALWALYRAFTSTR